MCIYVYIYIYICERETDVYSMSCGGPILFRQLKQSVDRFCWADIRHRLKTLRCFVYLFCFPRRRTLAFVSPSWRKVSIVQRRRGYRKQRNPRICNTQALIRAGLFTPTPTANENQGQPLNLLQNIREFGKLGWAWGSTVYPSLKLMCSF